MLSSHQGIETIIGLSPNEIPKVLLESKNPVILKGLVANWPLVQAANNSPKKAISYLEKFSTEESWTVFKGEPEIDGRVFYNSEFNGFNFEVVGIPFKELIKDLLQSSTQASPPMIYVGSTMIDRWLPKFRSENDIDISHDALASIWMGNQSRIAAHYD
jgi:hypothetical protein